MSASLEVGGLCVSYGAIEALRDVTLAVEPGETVAILGANGAGKSTLLRTISGLMKPTAGEIVLAGEPIACMRPARIARRGVAHVPEGREVFARLTVLENLRLGTPAAQRGRYAELCERAFALFPRLADRRDQAAGTMSGGEQQMLAIARALMSEPRLLMLDEPSMGLSPLVVQAIFASLQEIQGQMSVLLVEQNARAALELAQRGYLLESGRVVATGAAGELGPQAIEAAYLGRAVGAH
jgi:branched-chain amino acid transport system ATP-binding protein